MISLYIWIATQIIIESFPVSSSTHLKIIESLLQKKYDSSFLLRLPRYFDDFLHICSLGVMSIFFFKRWSILLMYPWQCLPITLTILMHTFISSSITVGLYFLFNIYNVAHYFPTPLGIIITMICLLSSYYCPQSDFESLTIVKSIILGCVQGFALLPGISRLGSTYVAARWLRLSPQHALETSCIIQAPLIGAAVVRACIYLWKSPFIIQFLNVSTVLVMLFASIIAYEGFVLVWYFMKYNLLWIFSLYLIVPLSLVIYWNI